MKLDHEGHDDEHEEADDDERGEGTHREPDDSGAVTVLDFLTREGCPLCDDARSLLEPAARRAGIAVRIVDIDLDLDLPAEFDDRVPVVRDGASGVVLAEGRIDAADVALAVAFCS